MDNLTDLQKAVKNILEYDEYCRCSDYFLYLYILDLSGVDIKRTSIYQFYRHFNDHNVPRFESVARARRKVQELYPELKSKEPVKTWRKNNEREFRKFAREGK